LISQTAEIHNEMIGAYALGNKIVFIFAENYEKLMSLLCSITWQTEEENVLSRDLLDKGCTSKEFPQ